MLQGNLRRSHRLMSFRLRQTQVTTKSGLQYVDIVPGKGPNPQSGYQVQNKSLTALCTCTAQSATFAMLYVPWTSCRAQLAAPE